jgi:hypothetical protein
MSIQEDDYAHLLVQGPQLPKPIIDDFPDPWVAHEEHWWVVTTGREVGVCFGEYVYVNLTPPSYDLFLPHPP